MVVLGAFDFTNAGLPSESRASSSLSRSLESSLSFVDFWGTVVLRAFGFTSAGFLGLGSRTTFLGGRRASLGFVGFGILHPVAFPVLWSSSIFSEGWRASLCFVDFLSISADSQEA